MFSLSLSLSLSLSALSSTHLFPSSAPIKCSPFFIIITRRILFKSHSFFPFCLRLLPFCLSLAFISFFRRVKLAAKINNIDCSFISCLISRAPPPLAATILRSRVSISGRDGEEDGRSFSPPRPIGRLFPHPYRSTLTLFLEKKPISTPRFNSFFQAFSLRRSIRAIVFFLVAKNSLLKHE